MTREHLSPACGPVRTGLGVIALAAALAMATSACQSSSSKASVVGQDPTTTSSAAVGAPGTNASSSPAPAAKSSGGGGGAQATVSAPAGGGGAFKVGQQIKIGDYTVTVHKVTYPYSNDLDQPESGKAYLLLDLEVANNSSKTQTVAGLMQYGIKDSANNNYDETIVMGVHGEGPEGDIAPGKSMRGPVAFEVPAGAKGLRFSFLPDLGGDKTFIDLGV